MDRRGPTVGWDRTGWLTHDGQAVSGATARPRLPHGSAVADCERCLGTRQVAESPAGCRDVDAELREQCGRRIGGVEGEECGQKVTLLDLAGPGLGMFGCSLQHVACSRGERSSRCKGDWLVQCDSVDADRGQGGAVEFGEGGTCLVEVDGQRLCGEGGGFQSRHTPGIMGGSQPLGIGCSPSRPRWHRDMLTRRIGPVGRRTHTNHADLHHGEFRPPRTEETRHMPTAHMPTAEEKHLHEAVGVRSPALPFRTAPGSMARPWQPGSSSALPRPQGSSRC